MSPTNSANTPITVWSLKTTKPRMLHFHWLDVTWILQFELYQNS